VGEQSPAAPCLCSGDAVEHGALEAEVVLRVDNRLQHIQACLPSDVLLTSRRHPLVGHRVRAEQAHRWNGEIWLVVRLPDGYLGRVRIDETDLSGDGQADEPTAVTFSVKGIRALRELVARLRSRLEAEAAR
jgi:hypothetical protein